MDIFQTGSLFVTSWHLEIDQNGTLQSYITVNFATDNKDLLDQKIRINMTEAHFGQQKCDVTLDKHFIRSLDGLKRFQLYIDPETNDGYELHLELNRLVPSFRPGPDNGMERILPDPILPGFVQFSMVS